MLREENAASVVVGLRTNEDIRYAFANLYDSLSDPDYGPSLEPHRSPFAYGIRNELPNATFFDFVRQTVRFDLHAETSVC